MLETGKLCRREINERVRIVVAATWAVAEELVLGDRAHALEVRGDAGPAFRR